MPLLGTEALLGAAILKARQDAAAPYAALKVPMKTKAEIDAMMLAIATAEAKALITHITANALVATVDATTCGAGPGTGTGTGTVG